MPSRRDFARYTLTAAVMGLPSLLSAAPLPGEKKRKIVCVGGHPDDPETGCGGTLALLSGLGHDVTIIYLTRGEAGIDGTGHKEAAAIRSKEAEAACRILKAKPVFAGQIDGDTVVNNEWVITMKDLIAREKPDIVFTHWPVDTHKDHQSASLLTIQSWEKLNKSFDLYFFEVCTGNQTRGFKPTDYVNITTVQDQKRKAVYCHTSQGPDDIYNSDDCNHALMEAFRGKEINVKAAEAFVKLGGNSIV
ncbi:PIG-L deacetylase family protein [Flavihumibacter profundi]|uniref:PIG-L deacetylase family protein n=1 Tax=Flavihumibacter profundi TaxID=2716883 RepID=UPI001CC394E9|nr:PIG-L deacetylase family protein [Flavihumibacter profundi]MBZ5856455.1 PIG-L family deacetylase [Flavihumibacter profundi]